MRKRKHQQRKRSRSDSGRARSSRRGFCSTQRVISTPPLSSHNRYACLVVDQCEDATSVSDCVKVVPQPSVPPLKTARIRLANWERRLPKRFVIATTPSENLLNIDIEIEMANTSFERQAQCRSAWRRPSPRTQRPYPSATPSHP